MENIYKTLWDPTREQFVVFEFSPLVDEVHWYRSTKPQLMDINETVETLLNLLPKNTILPIGTEMKSIKLTFTESE